MKTKSLLIAVVVFLIAYCLVVTLASAQVIQLYGMTEAGGANGLGVLFQFGTDSVYTKRVDFAGTTNGANPYGSLMQASDGNLYGMTEVGGANNVGALFQYNTVTSAYSKKFDFGPSGVSGVTGVNGAYPYGSLMQASDGNLYGMTRGGGANNSGVIFQYNTASSTYTKKYDLFDPEGEFPYGDLIESLDGKLFGLASSGGAYNKNGVLFEFDPATDTYTKKHDFDEASGDGGFPHGSLILATDGNLYGMTVEGGNTNFGTIFRFNPNTSVYAKIYNFGIGGNVNGVTPVGSLMQESNGNLYGMTVGGGNAGCGVLFQFNPVTSSYTKKIDFTGVTNGVNPFGSLMQASDGNLYGMTRSGGAAGMGVLFQYNPVTSTYTKKLDFTAATGQNPMYSKLIEVAGVNGINELSTANYIALAPNPARDELTIHTSSFQNEIVTVSVMNVLGEMMQEEKLKWSSYFNISIKNLPTGIYFLEMKTGKETLVKKFVKE